MQETTIIDPNPQKEQLINNLAEWIARHGLLAPAVFLLESNKPFGFLGSQALWMIQPLMGPVIGYGQVKAYARLLEDRSSIEQLLVRLESYQAGSDNSASTGA